MKATGLMIGDYVQFFEGRELRYEKVTAIIDEGNDQRYVQTAESDVFHCEETYMPIPLTADILHLREIFGEVIACKEPNAVKKNVNIGERTLKFPY